MFFEGYCCIRFCASRQPFRLICMNLMFKLICMNFRFFLANFLQKAYHDSCYLSFAKENVPRLVIILGHFDTSQTATSIRCTAPCIHVFKRLAGEAAENLTELILIRPSKEGVVFGNVRHLRQTHLHGAVRRSQVSGLHPFSLLTKGLEWKLCEEKLATDLHATAFDLNACTTVAWRVCLVGI